MSNGFALFVIFILGLKLKEKLLFGHAILVAEGKEPDHCRRHALILKISAQLPLFKENHTAKLYVDGTGVHPPPWRPASHMIIGRVYNPFTGKGVNCRNNNVIYQRKPVLFADAVTIH